MGLLRQRMKDARNILAQYNLTPSKLSLQGAAPTANTPVNGSGVRVPPPKTLNLVPKNKARKAKKKKKKSSFLDIQIGGGPTNEDVSVFTRQMSTLIQAGLPLLRSLEVMIKQQEKKPKFKSMLEAVAEKVSSGGTLSDGSGHVP
jgi:type IV pilus assembly protein PilC